jgi:Glycosyl hydrolase family 20, domain 2
MASKSMDRRRFLCGAPSFGAGLLAYLASTGIAPTVSPDQTGRHSLKQFNLIPYPQKVILQPDTVRIVSRPEISLLLESGTMGKLGRDQLNTFFQKLRISQAPGASPIRVVLGSADRSTDLSRWLPASEIYTLRSLNPQGYILRIAPNEILIIGRDDLGTLYGVQTLLQMLNQSMPEMRLPCLQIEDYPEVPNRYVDVTLAWYAHYYNNTFGYGTQLWSEEQWRWFVDWCLLHKINGVDLCIYGYWPFRFAKYPETVLANIPVRTYDPETEKNTTVRMTHQNIEHEFLPSLIRYARDRGIRINAYIGLNTFNGGFAREHPEALPFSPAQWENLRKHGYSFPVMDYMLDLCNVPARQYLRACLRRIMGMGFDGVTFEMIELPASVCTKPSCVSKYWKGYRDLVSSNSIPKLTPLPVRTRADADILNDLYRVITQVNPQASVGLIYHRIVQLYGWGAMTLKCFKQFRAMIPPKVYFLQGPRAPRNGLIEGSEFERWVQIANPRTYRHSDNIGGDAAAYQRLLYINNDPSARGDKPVPSLEWEIAQHRAAAKLNLQGATGYAFEWYGEEIYPLILAQYSWRSSGPEGVSDHGFLEYASQSMYGKRVGSLTAKALALSPPPMDHYPSPWVERANEAAHLAQRALNAYAGSETEYGRSLEQISTATRRKAWLYDVERSQTAAKHATGEEKKEHLEQALAKSEQVANLILNGKPRVNYRKGFFGRFQIFAVIQKLAGELGVAVAEKYKPI